RTSSLKCRLRNVLAHYNADRRDLLTAAGFAHLKNVPLHAADRLVADQLCAELAFQKQQRGGVWQQLKTFAADAPLGEREARAVLASVPGIGPMTTEVILSELGDVRRFRRQDEVSQYAGLAPGVRESAGKRQQLSISKEGSPLLRWTMIQLAWRLVNRTRRWGFAYEKLRRRCGPKKAIVAVARRVLC